MKLTFNLQQLGQAPEIWLRSAGYTFIPEREDGQESFVRRLSRDFYPRFHIYFIRSKNTDGQEFITFNLHLDQKKPGYTGYSRHNAEYDGEIVEREIERLKGLVTPNFMV